MKDHSSSIVINKPTMSIKRYTDPWAGGAPPLSPYIYRAYSIHPSFIKLAQAGKYADILPLLSVLESGPFLWLGRPYACYRIHEASDNSQFVFKEKLRLLRCIHQQYSISKQSYLYLNAKVDYYRQFFGVGPSIRSLFNFEPQSRTAKAQALVTKLTIMRILRSNRFRMEKLSRLLPIIWRSITKAR
jgi:hypothetical protein